MIAVDTNVLVYAHRAETDLHRNAATRLQELCEGDSNWALPLPCITEFMRVVTHPKVFNPPSKLHEAEGFVNALVDSPTCQILKPDGTYLDQFFATVSEADARGNLIFDAQIVALCKTHGINNVLTNDRDFERFNINVAYL